MRQRQKKGTEKNGKKSSKFLLMAVLVLALGLTACEFHAGTSGNSDDYGNIFTDRAAELTSNYRASDLAYVFSVGDYGSMMVYVDTTDGHSFEVVPDSAEFVIKDKDDTVVIHAYFMDLEAYKLMTSESDEIYAVNGRDFVYRKDQAYHHMFSYMADCGLDLGMVLESDTNESVFRLVAFRGDAINGASSDVYTYKGDAANYDDYEEDEAPSDANDAADALNNSTKTKTDSDLPEEAKRMLNSLETDYHKVNWQAVYSAGEGASGVIISVYSFGTGNECCVIIGITNLYDTDISFEGNVVALNADMEKIEERYIYKSAIGSGYTVIEQIFCEDTVPADKLIWNNCEISTDVYCRYIPWEADWGLSGNPADGHVVVGYTIYGIDTTAFVPGTTDFFLLDDDGNIMAVGEDYVNDEIKADEFYKGIVNVYGEEEQLKQTKDIAMFVESAN